MYKSLLCASLAFFALAGLALADPKKCYACVATKAGKDDPCNDPVDTTKIGTCDNPQVTNGILESPILQHFNVTMKTQSAQPVAIPSGGACVKFTLSDGSTTLAGRSCAFKDYDGIDACAYAKKNTEIGNLKFVCSTCSTDLCNSASTAAISVLSFLGLFVALFALH